MGMEVLSARSALQGVETRRHSGIEVRRLDSDVATWRHAGIERRMCAASMQTWKYGGVVVWMWIRVTGVETQRHAALERWRRAAGVAIRR